MSSEFETSFAERVLIAIYRGYRSLLWDSPRLHKQYLGLRGYPVRLNDAQLVVQGFARSGNTFVTEAIKSYSKQEINVFSHLHVPVVVHEAIRSEVPVCFLIRKPEDAVCSLALHSRWSTTRCFEHYIAYHNIVRKYLPSLLLFDFADFTEDIQSLFTVLSDRVGLDFADVTHREIQANVFGKIEKRQLEEKGAIDESTVHRPSAERARSKRSLMIEIQSQQRLVETANDLFNEFKCYSN